MKSPAITGRYGWTLLAGVLALATAAQPFTTVGADSPASTPGSQPFAGEINAFEGSDRTNPPPRDAILFIGSSSIRLWTNLASDFPDHRVINRGFGGSQIIDSVNYFDRIVLPYRPKLIVLYAGGNDINAQKSPERVFADFRTFAGKVRAAFPKTRLAYVSIAPNPARWAQIEQVRAANQRIEAYVRTEPNLRFIDTHSQMLGPDGQPKPDIYLPDRLHMNAAGYRIWTRVIRPYLDDGTGPNAPR